MEDNKHPPRLGDTEKTLRSLVPPKLGLYTPEDIKNLDAREQQLLELRIQIQQREKEFDEYSAKIKKEQLAREQDLQKEIADRERFFVERTKELSERQKTFENHLQDKQRETDELRVRLEQEFSEKKSELQKTFEELQQEKERYKKEYQEKIDRTSKDYVSDTIALLGQKEAEFHKISKAWGIIGAGSLLVGIVFFGYVTVASFSSIPNPVTWEFITFVVFKGLIAVALFAALAKYSLLFSNSYMQEALKNADRRHAINFGKFYLASYGAMADWAQIKEAFENWNIRGENAFSKSENSKLDVTALDKFANTIENI
ncbi:MAG: hypothetical protein PHY54_13080 [Methylococcales bacterium]|nr:hypothetical protein [Methylococcales bacterium]